MRLSLAFTTLLVLSACPAPVQESPQNNHNTSSSALSAAEEGESKGPPHSPEFPASDSPTSPTPEIPGGTVQPQPSALAPALPPELARLQLVATDRFLEAKGESTRLEVRYLNAQGEPLDLDLPIEWVSSRPQDFSIDPSGLAQALVDFGFAEITAQIPNSAFKTKLVLNVTATFLSSGGGGGGTSSSGSSNTAPVINTLTATAQAVTGTGVPVRLTATASDAESTLTNANFIWSCLETPCGSFGGNGTSTIWSSPNASGTYTIRLSVSDGSAVTTKDLSISVQTGTGTITVN